MQISLSTIIVPDLVHYIMMQLSKNMITKKLDKTQNIRILEAIWPSSHY